jgi:hypothetical protein
MNRQRGAGAERRDVPRVVVLTYPRVDLLDVASPRAVFDALERAPGRSEREKAPGHRIEVISTADSPHVETLCRVGLIGRGD